MKEKNIIIVKNTALAIMIVIFYAMVELSYSHITCFTDTDKAPELLFLGALTVFIYCKTYNELKKL